MANQYSTSYFHGLLHDKDFCRTINLSNQQYFVLDRILDAFEIHAIFEVPAFQVSHNMLVSVSNHGSLFNYYTRVFTFPFLMIECKPTEIPGYVITKSFKVYHLITGKFLGIFQFGPLIKAYYFSDSSRYSVDTSHRLRAFVVCSSMFLLQYQYLKLLQLWTDSFDPKWGMQIGYLDITDPAISLMDELLKTPSNFVLPSNFLYFEPYLQFIRQYVLAARRDWTLFVDGSGSQRYQALLDRRGLHYTYHPSTTPLVVTKNSYNYMTLTVEYPTSANKYWLDLLIGIIRHPDFDKIGKNYLHNKPHPEDITVPFLYCYLQEDYFKNVLNDNLTWKLRNLALDCNIENILEAQEVEAQHMLYHSPSIDYQDLDALAPFQI